MGRTTAATSELAKMQADVYLMRVRLETVLKEADRLSEDLRTLLTSAPFKKAE